MLAKACYQPEALEEAELVVLEAYLTNQLNQSLKIIWQAEFGEFSESDPGTYMDPMKFYLRRILSWPQGATFLAQSDGFYRQPWPRYIEAVDEVMAENTESCRAVLNALRVRNVPE